MSASTALFGLLDACLDADRGPSGFTGKIGIGVIESKGLAWWVGDFGATVRRTRTNVIPDGCAASLILGEGEALRLLDGQPPGPTSIMQTFGDGDLLVKFARRYVRREDMIGLRVAQSTQRRTRR